MRVNHFWVMFVALLLKWMIFYSIFLCKWAVWVAHAICMVCEAHNASSFDFRQCWKVVFGEFLWSVQVLTPLPLAKHQLKILNIATLMVGGVAVESMMFEQTMCPWAALEKVCCLQLTTVISRQVILIVTDSLSEMSSFGDNWTTVIKEGVAVVLPSWKMTCFQ